MTVLIIGQGGQLATELTLTKPRAIEVVIPPLAELDLTLKNSICRALDQYQPHTVINAAAYTAVDKAESQAELSLAINANGVRDLTEACGQRNIRLIHISTDFVFDGRHHQPYTPEDRPNPLSVYGKTKLLGEQYALENNFSIVGHAAESRNLVVRTAWLYSSTGQNFVKTMLRLMSEREQLSVISDQVGTPTWARGLAECLWCMVDRPEISGLYHWSDAGVASWYDFAIAIQELGLENGLLTRNIPILPIPTEAYPTPAIRPSYSVLDKSKTLKDLGLVNTHWRKMLSKMLKEDVLALSFGKSPN